MERRLRRVDILSLSRAEVEARLLLFRFGKKGEDLR
jgi:hypothetical protein